MTHHKIIVIGFIHFEGKVLLAKRSMNKKICPGIWHLPGGHVEANEDPRDALKRELFEELGLVDLTVLYPIDTYHYSSGESHTIGITYEVPITILPNLVIDPNETSDVVWVTKKELPNYLDTRPGEDTNLRHARRGFSLIS